MENGPSWNDVKNGKGNFDYLFENDDLEECPTESVEENSNSNYQKYVQPDIEIPQGDFEELPKNIPPLPSSNEMDDVNIIGDPLLIAIYIILYLLCVLTIDVLLLDKIQISTLVLLMASYHLGVKKGLIVSFVCGFVCFFGSEFFAFHYYSLSEIVFTICIYGCASFFISGKRFYSGILVTNLIRDLYVVPYYYGSLNILTTIIGLIVIPILCNLMNIDIDKNNNTLRNEKICKSIIKGVLLLLGILFLIAVFASILMYRSLSA